MSFAERLAAYQAGVEAAEAGQIRPRDLDVLQTQAELILDPDVRPPLEYPLAVPAVPSGSDDHSLPSSRNLDPGLNADFLAAHRRNLEALEALL